MLLFQHLPAIDVDLREVGVAIDLSMDQREVNALRDVDGKVKMCVVYLQNGLSSDLSGLTA